LVTRTVAILCMSFCAVAVSVVGYKQLIEVEPFCVCVSLSSSVPVFYVCCILYRMQTSLNVRCEMYYLKWFVPSFVHLHRSTFASPDKFVLICWSSSLPRRLCVNLRLFLRMTVNGIIDLGEYLWNFCLVWVGIWTENNWLRLCWRFCVSGILPDNVDHISEEHIYIVGETNGSQRWCGYVKTGSPQGNVSARGWQVIFFYSKNFVASRCMASAEV